MFDLRVAAIANHWRQDFLFLPRVREYIFVHRVPTCLGSDLEKDISNSGGGNDVAWRCGDELFHHRLVFRVVDLHKSRRAGTLFCGLNQEIRQRLDLNQPSWLLLWLVDVADDCHLQLPYPPSSCRQRLA